MLFLVTQTPNKPDRPRESIFADQHVRLDFAISLAEISRRETK